jgi:DNA-binding PadR family transcriptional regulator
MARELAKGDIPVLILTVLAQGASHGYAIARESSGKATAD